MINMKWLLPLLFALSPAAFSAPVTCPDLATALNVEDEPCESISETAYRCWEQLNSEFYITLRQRQDITDLLADYEREIKKVKEEFEPKVRSYGGSCLNQAAQLEIWRSEMEKDLRSLRRRH